MIKNSKTLCIWKSSIYGKDVNDMVKIGYDVQKIIYSNSYSGLKAQNAFSEWRKC